MRWFQRSVALSAIAVSSAASVASAQSGAAFDVRRPKPIVMLLVDTSGSMERMPGPATATTTDDFPKCTGGASDATQKNRWAVTLEALTGTFQKFTCSTEMRSETKYKDKFDYNYYLPHYNFTTAANDFVTLKNQESDGVVDAFAQRIKFGLMTFDGISTTMAGDTLVPLARFTDDAAFKTAVAGAPGIYSYGDVGHLAFPGCKEVYGVNVGARGPGTHEGALVAVSDDGDGIPTVNQTVQDSLLSVRPFGGTPIAGMLDDLKYYLENDPSVKVGGSDAFAECRSRYAILITDGAPDSMYRDARFQCQVGKDPTCPNGGTCECPYDTEVNLAAELRSSKLLKKLIVVAFDVDESAQTILNEIAQNGGEQDAIPASTPADLRAKLNGILGNASDDAASRSIPQLVDNGLPPYAGGQQYEITAGFRLGADENDPWEGLLYRQRFACQAGSNGAPPSPVPVDLTKDDGDMFHVDLTAQAGNSNGRTIVTVVPTPVTAIHGTIFGDQFIADSLGRLADRYTRTATDEKLANTYNIRAPTGTFQAKRPAADSSLSTNQGDVATGYSATNFDDSLVSTLFGEPDGDGKVGEADDRKKKIVRYVRADPSERKTALADIYHSNPVVLPPLTSDSRYIASPDSQLSAFLKNVATPRGTITDSTKLDAYGTGGRPGVVFVGTNDGLLHAFNLDTWKDKSGNEQKGGYEFWGFVPPALFGKLAAASTPSHQEMFDGTPQIRNMLLYRDSSTRVGRYGTVLVSALRGAPAYVAMDVTVAHEAPKFLWQFSAPAMGLTVATPALAQARVLWNDESTPTERAIAILPGGQGSASSDDSCTTTLVDKKTLAKSPLQKRAKVRCWKQMGRSLYVVDVATGQLLQEFDSQHFPSPLTGSVAVDGEGPDVSSAAYFTDQDGVLWRLSMLDPNPSNWLVEPLWDLFHDDYDSLKGYKKGRPSINPPLLSRDPEGNYVILVGTGDVDNLVEKQDTSNPPDPIQHRVVSLKETRTISGSVFTGSVDPNWDMALEPGESVTGPLSLFNKVLYFGTFVSPQTGNACDFGFSRLWGIHYMDKGSDGKEPKPMFPNGVDEDKNPILVSYIDQNFTDSLILGVSIGSDPVCVQGLVSSQYSTFMSVAPDALIGGGQYQIRALISGQGGTQPIGSALNQYNQTLAIPSEARFVGWGGSLE